MRSSFTPGTVLDVRGERWTLTQSTRFDDCAVLTLEGCGVSNRAEHLSVIEPFERARAVVASRPRRATRQSALRRAARAIVDARPSAGLWTAAAANIELWPYQLEPALAAIAGSTRLLLADAVGLGKTIQASLLLSELRARGWIDRALILCPAGLRQTWVEELRRFQIDAAVVDQAAIAERIAMLPPGINPWTGSGTIVSSIDFVKRSEIQAALTAVPIDLLIVDEAHHLVPGTDRAAAASVLASRVPWCVLVSATPHSGDAAAFEFLCGIGAMDDRLSIYRRTRADVGIESRRHTHVLKIAPTADEQALLDAIDAYATAIWNKRGRHDRAVQLVAMTLARRAASSAAAISRTLMRRLALLTTAPAEVEQPRLPWSDEDTADDIESDGVLSAAGFDHVADECEVIRTLIALANRCGSSKMNRLSRLLTRLQEPAIIFTEYRDSLEFVIEQLRGQRRIGAIHGGLPIDLRRSIVDAFNSGGIDLLVATDTAGEGLNLQARCRLVIDLELPWNPMRLEQRIGRVDRLGQRRTVHAIHFVHAGSIEERVLDHVQLRSHAAAAALCPASERDVSAAIFEGGSTTPRSPIVMDTARISSSTAEAGRLNRQRGSGTAATSSATVWAKPRHRARSPLIVVVRTAQRNDAGVLAGETISAYRVDVSRWPNTNREWRALLGRVRTALSDVAVPSAIESRAHPVIHRIAAIRSALASLASMPYQGSLFDSRSEISAAARRQRAALLDASLERVLRHVAAPGSDRVDVEIVAAWPERRT